MEPVKMNSPYIMFDDGRPKFGESIQSLVREAAMYDLRKPAVELKKRWEMLVARASSVCIGADELADLQLEAAYVIADATRLFRALPVNEAVTAGQIAKEVRKNGKPLDAKQVARVAELPTFLPQFRH